MIGLASVSVAGLVGLLAVGSVDAAAFLQARARATVAADAAALAAADAATWLSDADPRAEAERLAAANGATLIVCDCEDGEPVTVTVEVAPRALLLVAWRRVRVRASARAGPRDWVASWAPG